MKYTQYVAGLIVLLMATDIAGPALCCAAPASSNSPKPVSNNTATYSASTPSTTSGSSGNGSADASAKMTDGVNFADIMQKCNGSNAVTMEYLAELNSTGSFPDETDKGPMCYIKCYLEGVGILNEDGSVNNDRAISMLWPNSLDAIDDCLKEQEGVFDKDASGACENAYYLTRCVMVKELLSQRTAAMV